MTEQTPEPVDPDEVPAPLMVDAPTYDVVQFGEQRDDDSMDFSESE